MMILKVTQKQSFAFTSGTVFLNIFLGLRRGFFLNETSVLVFLKLERASEKLVGKSLGKGYDASYVF